MKAVCWYGTGDVRVETVPEPKLINPRDAIVKVTLAAICGSDIHLYDGCIPTMHRGDILGHEFMGEVVETGSAVHTLRPGDRVMVPFAIACGQCFFCTQQWWSLCDNSNPNAWMAEKLYGYSPAGLFGYSHMLGGYAGGQAEYVRVPFADVGPIKIPAGLQDEQVLFLSDIFPTGYMAAENCHIQRGDTVAVWGWRQANTLLDQTRHTLDGQARTLGRQARALLAQARPLARYERGRGEMGRGRAEQMQGTTGLLVLGSVGLGVGLMYLLDPSVGARRRALVRDKARASWRTTGTFIERTARDARNRARGLVSEARTQFRGADVPDDTALEERVRAQLGHAMSHGGAIRVNAHQGRVTLSGPISPSAADKLLETVASVPGVTEVVNRLDVRAEHISGWHDGNPIG